MRSPWVVAPFVSSPLHHRFYLPSISCPFLGLNIFLYTCHHPQPYLFDFATFTAAATSNQLYFISIHLFDSLLDVNGWDHEFVAADTC